MLKEISRSLRSWWLKLRLRSRGKICENLAFQDIEKRYLGRAANFQLEGWRTLYREEGQLYRHTEHLNGEEQEKIIKEPDRKIFLANDGCVFSSRGIVYNPYYHCTVLETVEEWGNDVNQSTEFRKIKGNPEKYIAGISFSLLSLGAVYNYAHFLFDSISRLALLQNIEIEPDQYLVPGPRQPWKEKVFEELDLTDRLIWIEEDEEVRCEQLMFTNRITFARHCTPFAAEAVRHLFIGDPEREIIPYRIVFASRNAAKDRKTRMEKELIDRLPDCVEVVDFEQLTMKETVQICRETKLFMGFHGAAFANIIFCGAKTKIIEIQIRELLPDWHRGYYQTILKHYKREHLLYYDSESSEIEGLTNVMLKQIEIA